MSDSRSERALLERLETLVREATGRSVVSMEELPPGLGERRFVRARLEGGPTLVARIEPPDASADVEPPLEPIRALLEQSDVPVPARVGGDPAAGIELLEDVGDRSLERAVRDASDELRTTLYASAIELVPRLQRVAPAPGVAAFDRALDAELIASKARKWIEWSLPALLGREASAAERAATERAFAVVSEACERAPKRLAHRDYKAANIHVLATDPPRLVLIDLQGAFMAPPEYDLVCLLRDAHVALPEDEVDAHLARARRRLPDRPASDAFARRVDLITLARVAKDVSHYLHAARARGDDRYVRFVPTGLANLRRAAPRAAERDAAVGDFARLLSDLPEAPSVALGGAATEGPSCAP